MRPKPRPSWAEKTPSPPGWTFASARDSIRARATIAAFGGIDILINTAALFPSSPDGAISDEQWASTLEVNVTANYLLADEAATIFDDQGIDTSMVLTSSANAWCPSAAAKPTT